MGLFISAWALFSGAVVLYSFGSLHGSYSKPILIIYSILLAVQIVVSLVRKARETVLQPLLGIVFIGLTPITGVIHNWGTHALPGNSPGPDLVSNIPLVVVFALIGMVVSKDEGAGANLRNLFFAKPNFIAGGGKQKPDAMYPDVRICKDSSSGKDIYINGQDRFLHTMIVGPTGGGKTALMLEPMVNQDIEFIARGGKARVIVVEPDGTFTSKLAKYCESLNVPYYRIDATNPKDFHWNPLEGDPETVAETLTTVLQDSNSNNDFFSDVNSTVARNTTLLLKLLHGDDMTIMDLNETLLDVEVLLQKIAQLVEKRKKRLLSEEEEFIADNLIKTFQAELSNDFKKDKYQSVSMGLRQKVGRLIGNPNIRRIMMGKSNFHFDDFLETPGVLLLNTGNNDAGDTFGMFFLLSKNDAALRRPGTEDTRPAVLTYVDEYKRYANSKYVTSLTQGRKYRDAQTLAFQNFSQLDLPGDQSFKKEVKGNCRHKIILSGLEYDDALEASRMTGEQEVKDESVSYQKGTFFRDGQRQTERTVEKARYSANDLMLMEWNQVVYKIVRNKQTLAPAKGIVEYAKPKTLQKLQGSSLRPKFKIPSLNMPKVTLPKLTLPKNEPETSHQEDTEEELSPYQQRLLRELEMERQTRYQTVQTAVDEVAAVANHQHVADSSATSPASHGSVNGSRWQNQSTAESSAPSPASHGSVNGSGRQDLRPANSSASSPASRGSVNRTGTADYNKKGEEDYF